MQQLKILTQAANAESLSELLFEQGALAVTFADAKDQPIYEPTALELWQDTYVIALFDTIELIENTLAILKKNNNTLVYQQETLPEKNWAAITQANFPPLHFGEHLWICAPWHTLPNDDNANVVIINPGLAFGTGTHATTALCLSWLEKNIQKQNLLIDYGCGSGILGIAAKKLGIKTIYATDNDPQALEATAANAELNHFDESFFSCFPEKLPALQADILIANILAQPLIELAASFAQLVKPNGKIVLSGILKEQLSEVSEHYQQWFIMENSLIKEEWGLLEGTKKA